MAFPAVGGLDIGPTFLLVPSVRNGVPRAVVHGAVVGQAVGAFKAEALGVLLAECLAVAREFVEFFERHFAHPPSLFMRAALDSAERFVSWLPPFIPRT